MPETVISSRARTKLGRVLHVTFALLCLLWFVLADALAGRAARGLAQRFDLELLRPLLSAFFLIFLVLVGYLLLARMRERRNVPLRDVLGLPQRGTARAEWSLGLAIGWGAAVAAILPMALARSLHVRFWTEPHAFLLFAVHLLTLLFTGLATEMALRGYPFRRLVEGIGPVWAAVAMAALLALAQGLVPDAGWITVVAAALFSVGLSVAWLRTHGLWLPWGLHVGWNVSVALLFGLPIGGVASFASVIETRAVGRYWLTGGEFGPGGSLITLFVLLAAMVVLVRTTDDYAWDYTRPVIVAAGYEVSPIPTAAHVAMEQAVPPPPALVQILPTTPQSRSAHRGQS